MVNFKESQTTTGIVSKENKFDWDVKQSIMCGRWKTTCLPMADGKAIIYTFWMFYGNMFNNVADAIQHCVRVVTLVPHGGKDVIMPCI